MHARGGPHLLPMHTPEPSFLLHATYRGALTHGLGPLVVIALGLMDHNSIIVGLSNPHQPVVTRCACVRRITCTVSSAAACSWAFSIWGIIFLLQGVGVVYQWLPQGYGNDGWKARIINSIGAQADHIKRLLQSSHVYHTACGQCHVSWACKSSGIDGT